MTKPQTDKPMLVVGNLYKVRSDHHFWPNRLGKFRFWGGPKKDVVVLSDAENDQVVFAVGPGDIVRNL